MGVQSFRVTALRKNRRESEKVFLGCFELTVHEVKPQRTNWLTAGSEVAPTTGGCATTPTRIDRVHVRGVFCDSHGKLTGG